jgi:protease I
MASESGKKVLMVIASEGFRDPEYYEPKKVLEAHGIKVTTTSITKTAVGAEGGIVNTDTLLKDANARDYDAVVFIGGPGSYRLHDDLTAHQLAKTTVSSGKVLGAICAAVAVPARAGVLKGKKATSFSGVADIVKAGGAVYTGEGVTVDGKFVTADGARSAKAFGEALVKALT